MSSGEGMKGNRNREHNNEEETQTGFTRGVGEDGAEGLL